MLLRRKPAKRKLGLQNAKAKRIHMAFAQLEKILLWGCLRIKKFQRRP